MEQKYLVSFFYSKDNTKNGFGNTVMTLKEPVVSIKIIREVESTIVNRAGYDAVSILNITLLDGGGYVQ